MYNSKHHSFHLKIDPKSAGDKKTQSRLMSLSTNLSPLCPSRMNCGEIHKNDCLWSKWGTLTECISSRCEWTKKKSIRHQCWVPSSGKSSQFDTSLQGISLSNMDTSTIKNKWNWAMKAIYQIPSQIRHHTTTLILAISYGTEDRRWVILLAGKCHFVLCVTLLSLKWESVRRSEIKFLGWRGTLMMGGGCGGIFSNSI